MCFSALAMARVAGVVYGAKDLRLGACGTWIAMNDMKHPFHKFERVVDGILEDEAAALMKDFFKRRRNDLKKSAPTMSKGDCTDSLGF